MNKTLRLSNFKARTAMKAKNAVFFICVETIMYLLLFNLHDRTFNIYENVLAILVNKWFNYDQGNF